MTVKRLVALLIVSVTIVSCKSAFVDTLKKCSKSDIKCQKNLIQSVIHEVGENGIPEFNINPIDPLKIKELHIDVLDVVDLFLIDSVVKGAKDCEVLKFNTNFDTGHASVEILCDISIKGKYKATTSSPLVKTFLGAESVHGEGNGKVKIEKLKISFEFRFDVVKRANDIYIDCKLDKKKYTYDILGRVEFHADKLYVGKEELSQTIVKVMNENWKTITESLGKHLLDIAVGYIFDVTNDFFSKVPVKYFIIEDLSNYVVS